MKKIILLVVLVAIIIIIIKRLENNPKQTIITDDQVGIETSINYTPESFTPVTILSNQGNTITLKVTSPTDDQVHIHGYDFHFDIKANKEETYTFIADKTGRFEFELENIKQVLGFIEVYPS